MRRVCSSSIIVYIPKRRQMMWTHRAQTGSTKPNTGGRSHLHARPQLTLFCSLIGPDTSKMRRWEYIRGLRCSDVCFFRYFPKLLVCVLTVWCVCSSWFTAYVFLFKCRIKGRINLFLVGGGVTLSLSAESWDRRLLTLKLKRNRFQFYHKNLCDSHFWRRLHKGQPASISKNI